LYNNFNANNRNTKEDNHTPRFVLSVVDWMGRKPVFISNFSMQYIFGAHSKANHTVRSSRHPSIFTSAPYFHQKPSLSKNKTYSRTGPAT
jgi:hypothetical protein